MLYILFLICLFWSARVPAVATQTGQVIATLQQMLSVIDSLEDFICETEALYYKGGKEEQRYRFTFYYKKGGRIRITFSRPYPGFNVFYKRGDTDLTLKPFRFLPLVKVHLSIYNSLVRTPSGQRIDQADIEYLIAFLVKNLPLISEQNQGYSESEKEISLSFYALDYLRGKQRELYRVDIAKGDWFPVRIERYSEDGTPIEIIIFNEHTLNPQLEEHFFIP